MKKEGVALPVAVPMHRRDMPKGTLKSILKGAELTTEAFVELLKK